MDPKLKHWITTYLSEVPVDLYHPRECFNNVSVAPTQSKNKLVKKQKRYAFLVIHSVSSLLYTLLIE